MFSLFELIIWHKFIFLHGAWRQGMCCILLRILWDVLSSCIFSRRHSVLIVLIGPHFLLFLESFQVYLFWSWPGTDVFVYLLGSNFVNGVGISNMKLRCLVYRSIEHMLKRITYYFITGKHWYYEFFIFPNVIFSS